MWVKLKRQISSFESAVLTARGADGYPVSVRTCLVVNDERRELRVRLPELVEVQAGAASLLLHQHNQQLWNLRIVLVRGELAHTGNAWVFRPLPLTPSPSALRMIINCRKTARAYLRTRGLTAPSVPWDRLKAIKQH